MGKNKVKVLKIDRESSRRVTFNKRRIGLLKKAYEISVLCDVDIALIFASQNGEITCFQGARSSAEEVVMKFANIPEDERAKNHIQKYIDDANQVRNYSPRKIENEETFQAAVRKLFHSRPRSTSLSERNGSLQMEHSLHVRTQEIMEEIRDIQRCIGLYDLSLPIENLIFSGTDAAQMEFYIQSQLQNLQICKRMSSPIPVVWLDNRKDDRFYWQDQNFKPIYVKQECGEAHQNVNMENQIVNSLKTYANGSTYMNKELHAVTLEKKTYVLRGWDNFGSDMQLLYDGEGIHPILSPLPDLLASSSDFLPSNMEDIIIDHELSKTLVDSTLFIKT